MTTSPGKPSRILIGRIAAAHGIRGDVLVHSFAADPGDVATYGPLTDTSGTRTFTLNLVGVTAKGVIARIAGVGDRTSAEALRGTELFVDRAQLPNPQGEEFYHVDLIGLAAVSPEGVMLGRVIGVENYGAGDLLNIRLTGGGQSELVPFCEAYVPEVDIAAGCIVVRMPIDAADDSDEADRPEGSS